MSRQNRYQASPPPLGAGRWQPWAAPCFSLQLGSTEEAGQLGPRVCGSPEVSRAVGAWLGPSGTMPSEELCLSRHPSQPGRAARPCSGPSQPLSALQALAACLASGYRRWLSTRGRQHHTYHAVRSAWGATRK